MGIDGKELMNFEIFSNLDSKELNALASKATLNNYKEGDSIIDEDTSSSSLYFVRSGLVQVSRKTIPLAELGSGFYFGEMSLFCEQSRTASVKALEPSVIYRIPYDAFSEFIDTSPTVMRDIIKTLADRLQKENNAVVGHVVELREKYAELKEAHKQLLQTDKLASIGMLTAGIAHEVNNPLAILMLYIELLQDTFEEKNGVDEDYPEHLGRMKKASEAIRNIVMGLKNFVRTDDDENDLLNIDEVTQGSINLVSFLYKKEQIQIDTAFCGENIEVEGNLGKFQQVIMNLMSNAKDAMPEGKKDKRITLATEAAGDRCLVKVSDNGTGIKAENVKKIFEKFFTTKPVGKGTGLGLDIINSIVTEMAGKIDVESKEGEGTTFILSFPKKK